jgi:hypothetical protein
MFFPPPGNANRRDFSIGRACKSLLKTCQVFMRYKRQAGLRVEIRAELSGQIHLIQAFDACIEQH